MINHDTSSWFIMIYHDISWYIMIYHDISWYIMKRSWYHMIWYIMIESWIDHDISWIDHDISHHVISWSIHDLSWYIMINHDEVSWFIMTISGDRANIPGSFSCLCLPGYEKTLNGSCENVNECLTSPCNDVNSYCVDDRVVI